MQRDGCKDGCKEVRRFASTAIQSRGVVRDGPRDRTALAVPEALAILTAAAELPHGSRWVAALLQGMRQGECLGLTWDAVDFDTEALDVSWQLQALPYVDRATNPVGSGSQTATSIAAGPGLSTWSVPRPRRVSGSSPSSQR